MAEAESPFDMPGNLGGFLNIHHGDWPAYPPHRTSGNWFEILFQLSGFPVGTRFFDIDDIDQALLFRAGVKCGRAEDPFDKSNIHLAAWHPDLSILQQQGYVSGIVPITERCWHERGWQRFTDKGPIGFTTPAGFERAAAPDFDIYEDDSAFASFVMTEAGYVVVTDSGRSHVATTLLGKKAKLLERQSTKVQRIFELGYYDTCIREACVELEDRIRKLTGSEACGDRLTDAYIGLLRDRKEFLKSAVRTFRQELRMVFKLVRNVYMHSLACADEAAALVVLERIRQFDDIIPRIA
jgi:hypothetical protein